MEIAPAEPDAYWQQIAAHTSTGDGHIAPWPVQMQVAVLADGHELNGSAVQFSLAEPSTWSVMAVTDDGRLVRVVIAFDAEGYDFQQEQGFREKSPTPTVVEAWVRPLDDVVCLEIRKVGPRRNAFNQPTRDQFNVGDIWLRFASGAALELGVDQVGMHYHEDRQRTDQFIASVRAHTGI